MGSRITLIVTVCSSGLSIRRLCSKVAFWLYQLATRDVLDMISRNDVENLLKVKVSRLEEVGPEG